MGNTQIGFDSQTVDARVGGEEGARLRANKKLAKKNYGAKPKENRYAQHALVDAGGGKGLKRNAPAQ